MNDGSKVRKSTDTRTIFALSDDKKTRAPFQLKQELTGSSFLERSRVKQILAKVDIFGVIGRFVDLTPGKINNDARTELLGRLCDIFQMDRIDEDISKEGVERIDFKSFEKIEDQDEKNWAKAYICALFDENRESGKPVVIHAVAAQYNRIRIQEIAESMDLPVDLLVVKWANRLGESTEWADNILTGGSILTSPEKTHAQYLQAKKNEKSLEDWFNAKPEETDRKQSYFWGMPTKDRNSLMHGLAKFDGKSIQDEYQIYCARKENENLIKAFSKENDISDTVLQVMLKCNLDAMGIQDVRSGKRALGEKELDQFYKVYTSILNDNEKLFAGWFAKRGIQDSSLWKGILLNFLANPEITHKIKPGFFSEKNMNDLLRMYYVSVKGKAEMLKIVEQLSMEMRGNEKRLGYQDYLLRLHTALLSDLESSSSKNGEMVSVEHEKCYSYIDNQRELKKLPRDHLFVHEYSNFISTIKYKREDELNGLFIEKEIKSEGGEDSVIIPDVSCRDVTRSAKIAVRSGNVNKKFYDNKAEMEKIGEDNWVYKNTFSLNEFLKVFLKNNGVSDEKVENLNWLALQLIGQDIGIALDVVNKGIVGPWQTKDGKALQMPSGMGRKENHTLDISDPKNPKFICSFVWEKGSIDYVALGSGLEAIMTDPDQTHLTYEVVFNIDMEKVVDKDSLVNGAVSVEEIRYDYNIVEKSN